MKQRLKINALIAGNLFDRAACSVEGGGPHFVGCLGVRDLKTGQIDIYSYFSGDASSFMAGEVKKYLENFEINVISNSNRLRAGTPHLISGANVGDKLIACWSLADSKHNEAIAIDYGVFHNLNAMYEVVDDQFCDMLLLRIGEWEKNNPPVNEVSVPLAQAVFKEIALSSD